MVSPSTDRAREDRARRGAHQAPAIGLPWKVAIPVVVVATAVFVVVSLCSLHQARAVLNQELDDAGAALVTALACPPVESWAAARDSVDEVAKRVSALAGSYATYLAVKYGIAVDPPALRPRDTSGPFQDEQRRAIEDLRIRQERDRTRLLGLLSLESANGGPISSEILDAYVRDERTGSYVVRAAPESEPFSSAKPPRRYRPGHGDAGTEASIEILDGRIDDRPARAFSVPIRDESGDTTHRAFAFLSTGGIEAGIARLRRTLFLSGVAGVLLLGACAWFTTWLAIRPLHALIDHATAIAHGNLAHRIAVRTDDEIGMLARTMDSMVRRVDHALAEHQGRISDELHRTLIADAVPHLPGYDIDVLHLLARDVGGAYYDFLELPQGRTGIVVGEASARGASAAVNMVVAGALVRAEARRTVDVTKIVQNIAPSLRDRIPPGMRIDLAMLSIDPRDRTVSISGSPVLRAYRYSSSTRELIPLDEACGDTRALDVRLEPGDQVLLMNDGAERLRNPRGQKLGRDTWEKWLLEACRGRKGAFKPTLVTRIRGFLGKGKVTDDVVVVRLRAEPAREAVPTAARA